METDRLSLEPVTVAHAQELTDLFADPLLHEFVPFEPPTLEQQQERCQRWSTGRSPDGSEIWINWVAREKSSGHVIGHFQAGVKNDYTASVGYVVGRPHQGKGYAAEAMTAVLNDLKNRFQVKQVKAWTDTRNTASHRLARKLGMRQAETIVNADYFKGASSDEFVFVKDL
jgi:ribosomal-protein-alanine N-acetyltransferase